MDAAGDPTLLPPVTSQPTNARVSPLLPPTSASRRWPALCGRAGKTGNPSPAAGARVSGQRTEESSVPCLSHKPYAPHQAQKNKILPHNHPLNCNGKRLAQGGSMIAVGRDGDCVKKVKSFRHENAHWGDLWDGAASDRMSYEGFDRVERSEFVGGNGLFEKKGALPIGNFANSLPSGDDREIDDSNQTHLRSVFELAVGDQRCIGENVDDRGVDNMDSSKFKQNIEAKGENQKIERRDIVAKTAYEVRPSQTRQNNEAVMGGQRLGRIVEVTGFVEMRPSQSTQNVDARLGDQRFRQIDATFDTIKPSQTTQVIEARLGNRRLNHNGMAKAADESKSSQSSFFVEARVSDQRFNQNDAAGAVDEIGGMRPSQSGQSVYAGRGDQRVKQNVEDEAVVRMRPAQFGGQTQMNSRKRSEACVRVGDLDSFSGAKLGYGNQTFNEANGKLHEGARNEPSKSKTCLIDGGVSARTYRGRAANMRFAELDAKPFLKIVGEQKRAPEKRLLMSQSSHTREVVPRSNANAASREEVQKSLHLYRFWCRKLLKQGSSVGSFRVDSKAYEIMKQSNSLVNTGDPILGIVSGVEVGDEFRYRLELCIIGLHRRTCAGIDYIQGTKDLATSIVSSGVYNDKIDASDVIIYTGEGGRPKGKAFDGENQQLTKGNLGLKNCIDEQTPVRVIRGIKENQHKDSKHKVLITYIYYGLYLVEKYWSEIGRHGFLEYKFQLRRMPDQPKLTTLAEAKKCQKFKARESICVLAEAKKCQKFKARESICVLAEAKKCQKFKARESICVADISKGKEQIKIPAVNNVDNEMPPSFTYVSKMLYPASCGQEFVDGCSCTDGCSDSSKCWCAIKNGDRIPFNYDGAIVCAKPMVYECGPFCKCPSSCNNRVTQKGIKLPLEIFKTDKKGWALRCLSSIPSGAFICEYVGELLQDREAKKRIGHVEYLFEIGRSHNDKFFQDEQTYKLFDNRKGTTVDKEKKIGFTIDAANFGNVGRFINHSCAPNLYSQNILYDHDDEKIPHVMFFAAEYIPALNELTYDYNNVIDLLHDSNENNMKKECFCGSATCSGTLY